MVVVLEDLSMVPIYARAFGFIKTIHESPCVLAVIDSLVMTDLLLVASIVNGHHKLDTVNRLIEIEPDLCRPLINRISVSYLVLGVHIDRGIANVKALVVEEIAVHGYLHLPVWLLDPYPRVDEAVEPVLGHHVACLGISNNCL